MSEIGKKFGKLTARILAGILCITGVCFACFFSACGKENTTEDVTITISKTEIEIVEGESYTLTVTVSPADAKDKKIEWRSSDAAIATVDGGVVKGIKAGETTVTAHTNDKTVTCKVKVKAKSDQPDSGSSSQTSASESQSDETSSVSE